ncbi:MAG: pyridoxal-phosphate dependent enzyme, partial [Ferroplasma sp.]
MSIYNSIIKDSHRMGIGNTPIIKLGSYNIYSKLEYYNKFHSIKDRAAFFMIDYAIKTGELDKNKIIIEASSGNTGIAIAGIARSFGIRSEIVIPENSAPGTRLELEKLGAKVITTPGGSTEASINYMESAVAANPHIYFNPQQHMNKLNSDAHYYGTAPEIALKLKKIDSIVIGVGTGGTITGLARYFKRKSPKTEIIGV